MKPRNNPLCFFLAFALSCVNTVAQESGSVTGQVLDPTGAAVIDAKVTVKNDAMGATFTTRSDQTGFYRVPQLLPGSYTITTSAEGFRTLVREGIIVQVNDRLRVDMALAIGQVGDTVTVEGKSPLLQTEDATAGQVINTQKIVDLPLNSRNWLQLATLAPGTVTYPGVADLQAGNQQNIAMNLGGARQSQANFILDGTDNTNFVSGGAVTYPPVDSLQEFKVETNNYTADVGRLGGPVVNASIKSGSNQLHGSLYDFLRNRELNARNFFANPQAVKPEFTRNQLGASAGAPLIRNKLFVFLNYEGNRQRQDQIISTQVFTSAQKAGNFAPQLGAVVGQDGLGRSVAAGQIFDPFSVTRLPNGVTAIRDAFPGNIIPASRLNPVAQKLINLVPGPNTSGSPNFIADLSNPLDIDTFAGRVDFVHSTKDSVFGHFIYSDQSSVTAPIFGLPVDGNTGLLLASNNRQLGAGWTHIFSPTNLSEFRLSYTRNLRLTRPAQSDQDVNAQFGIALPYPGNGVGGLANMSISGYTTLGTQSGTFPQYMNKYELSENYTVIRGPHTFKFGAQAETKLFENDNSCNNCRGVYSFNGVYTQQVGFSNTGSAVADFLTGVINTANFANVRNVTAVGHDLDLYAQDKWSINRKLTVTLGVRYQYHPPSTAKQGAVTNVIWGPGFTNPQVVVGQNLPDSAFSLTKNVLLPYIPVVRAGDVGLDGGLVHNNSGSFAPRLGIAYQLAPKTVLRTGYGVFYGYLDASSGGLTSNPPGNLGISTSGNTVDPTLVLGEATFGSNPFSRALTAPAFIGVRDPNWKPEFTQMYNLSIQHQFSENWLVEAGFMGNNSSRLSVLVNDNDAAPVPPSNTSTPQSRRRVSANLGDLPCYCPQGFSHYNAMTLNVEKRLSSGLTLLANFTWSRALGFAPPLYWGINSASILDPTNLKREYGPLEFDIIKRFVVSYTYDLPFGRSKAFGGGVSGIVDRVIGGWQLSGITTLQGGFPFTPTLSTSLGKTFTSSRPNVIGDPTASARQPQNWISPAAFAVPSTAEVAAGNYFGNAGRGSLREPGLVNFDFSVMKNTAIREGMRLQFRAELYNLTNTPYFGGNGFVNNNYNSPSFGKVTQAGDPRVVQFGMKLLF